MIVPNATHTFEGDVRDVCSLHGYFNNLLITSGSISLPRRYPSTLRQGSTVHLSYWTPFLQTRIRTAVMGLASRESPSLTIIDPFTSTTPNSDQSFRRAIHPPRDHEKDSPLEGPFPEPGFLRARSDDVFGRRTKQG